MTDSSDWRRDVRDALRRENWSLSGPNRVVKVLPRSNSPIIALGGYITIVSSLLGKTPQQIESALGLPLGYLASGARVFRFTRLPMAHEYEYELTAQYPNGLAFNPAHSDPSYPSGDRAIHQWRIRDGIQIPVDRDHFLDLSPGQRFPYAWVA